jgi:hypothetical protein
MKTSEVYKAKLRDNAGIVALKRIRLENEREGVSIFLCFFACGPP